MKLKIAEKTVTYNDISNGEEIIVLINGIKSNSIMLKNSPISNQSLYGNINILPGNLSFVLEEGEVLNDVNSIKKVKDFLITQGLLEADITVMEDLTWSVDEVTYPIRLSISKDELISTFSSILESEKEKGNPSFIKENYIVLYVTQILPEHLLLLENNDNVLIENY